MRFCRLPFDEKLTRVPDDGFYYLNLARNFAVRGDWSFDAGVSHTTGFHPIHAFVAAGFAHFVTDPRLLLVIHGALGFLLTFFAAGCVLSILGHDLRASCGALFVFAGGACLSCPLMAMEWPYVVALHAMLVGLVLRGRVLGAFTVGVLATLARLDAVVPVACSTLAVVAWALHHRRRGRSMRMDRVQAAVVAFAGALFAFLGYGLYLWRSTGFFFQGSARMKTHWAAMQGFEPFRLIALPWRTVPFGWWLIENRAQGVAAGVALVCAAAAGVALWNLRRERERERTAPPPVDRLPFWMALATLLGTYGVYAVRLTSSQPWYTAHFVVPMAILMAMGSRALFRATDVRVPCAALLVAGASSFVATSTPIWPHQRLLESAGEWIRSTGKRVGAYNAGILGYVSGSHVVNLDGLVNDDIHPYILDGRTVCYIQAVDIDMLVDTDCSNRSEDALDTVNDDVLAPITRRVHTFGRAPDEPSCVVAAWRIDRAKLHDACRRASSD